MGQICAHFGWTLDYLLWGIEWSIVQRMLIDAPTVKSEDSNSSGEKEIDFTEQSVEDIEALLNNYK